MKSTKIVFIVIGILVSLPIVFLVAREIWAVARGKAKKFYRFKVFFLLALLAGFILFNISLYRFTVDYQAPLVAENFLGTFAERLQGEISGGDYIERLRDKGLIAEGFVPIDHSLIEEKNLSLDGYSISLSERIFETDGAEVMLCVLHEAKGQSFYTGVWLEPEGKGWKVTDHRLLDEEQIQEFVKNTRFYTINF